MPTDAQKKANLKYQQKKTRVVVWCDPIEKSEIENVASAAGLSVNAYVKEAINEKMNRDGKAGVFSSADVE